MIIGNCFMDAVGSSQKPCTIDREESSHGNGSFASQARFIGRDVYKYTGGAWDIAHFMVREPVFLFGALMGAAAGAARGGVGKMYQHVRGQDPDTRTLANYAYKPAEKVYKFLKNNLDKPLMPVTTLITIPVVLSGAAIAVVGTVLPAVSCVIYKGVKHAIGQGAETKKLSEYCIKMFDLAKGLYAVGMFITGGIGLVILAAFLPMIGFTSCVYPTICLAGWFYTMAVAFPATLCQGVAMRPLFS